MSIIPIHRLASSDLSLLGNNLRPERLPRVQITQRRWKQPPCFRSFVRKIPRALVAAS